MKSAALAMAKPFIFVYNKTHWFTDQEAWGVYRFAAFVEAGTWALLISAIVYRRLGLPEADSVVSFAGRVHGMAFVVYIIFVLVVARSMEWGIGRIALAVAAGSPPFGSLVFEKLMSHYRKRRSAHIEPPKNLEG